MLSLLTLGGTEWVPSKHLPHEWSNSFIKSTKQNLFSVFGCKYQSGLTNRCWLLFLLWEALVECRQEVEEGVSWWQEQ